MPHSPIARPSLTDVSVVDALRPTVIAMPAILLLLAIAAASLTLPLMTFDAAFGRMYSEGWVAGHAARLAAGEALYSGDPWRPVNYPPLFFLLLAWLKPLFNDLLLIGRAVNLAAFLSISALAALIVRRLGGSRCAVLLAIAGVIGFQQIQAVAWIGANEPQMLAEALILGGLLCHLSGASTQGRLAATALLVVTGLFVKHNLVAIPLAITLDLWLRERRLLVAWCLWGAGVAATLLFLCTLAAGGNLLAELLVPRLLDVQALLSHPRRYLITFKIPLALAIFFLVRPCVTPHRGLLRGWGAVSLASATWFSLADGASFNLFLDAAIWLAIVMALALEGWLHRLDGKPSRLAVAALLPVLLLQPMATRLLPSLGYLRDRATVAQSYEAASDAFRRGAALLRAQRGPALCDDLLMCFTGGKTLVVDPFMARTQILAGHLAEAELIRRIEARQFAAIELPAPILQADQATIAPVLLAPPRFTEATLRAILRSYDLVRGTDTAVVFYVPRSR